ncbi:MAG: inositol monophosphatase family protein [Candidatus Bathyarchaeia archaeon]
MSSIDVNFCSASLVKISQVAGDVLLRYFRKTRLHCFAKHGRANLVTQADLASQKIIIKLLMKLFPDIPVVTEENPLVTPESEAYFLVDPLDGTLNFFHGIPFFSVSIALMINHKPLVGVVHAPFLNETFYAIKGRGTFLNAKELRTGQKKTLKEAIAVTGWPYDPSLMDLALRLLILVQKEVQEVRVFGACSLEMCYVAANFIDVYWEIGLCPWDLAAGWLIVEEAGGVVSDLDGGAFDLSAGRVLAVNSETLHRDVVKILRRL